MDLLYSGSEECARFAETMRIFLHQCEEIPDWDALIERDAGI